MVNCTYPCFPRWWPVCHVTWRIKPDARHNYCTGAIRLTSHYSFAWLHLKIIIIIIQMILLLLIDPAFTCWLKCTFYLNAWLNLKKKNTNDVIINKFNIHMLIEMHIFKWLTHCVTPLSGMLVGANFPHLGKVLPQQMKNKTRPPINIFQRIFHFVV